MHILIAIDCPCTTKTKVVRVVYTDFYSQEIHGM